MCRLLGIVASESCGFRIVLRESSRSLATLSQKHPDGWGLAVFDEERGWGIDKGTDSAHCDARFHQCASESRGVLLLSHIRLKTVGVTSLANTHPFQSDGWVFAHNGTIKDIDFLRAQVSAARLAGLGGETDSELFFAWFLTEMDRAGRDDADAVVKGMVTKARAQADFGAFNFLLSDGNVTYAHRFGRTLFILQRGPHDEVRRERESLDGMRVYTPWTPRRHALFIASEHMTDEPWEELAEGTLLRIERTPLPRARDL